jgi:hypothetical protein
VQQFLGGLALGALLGVAGGYVVQTFVQSPAADCADACGPGTRCEQGKCVVEPIAEPELIEPVEDGKSKRKGKRGKKGSSDEELAAEAGSGPAIDDDSHVPRFDADKDQEIGASDGSERLSDSVIDRELGELDGAFQACIRDGAQRVEALGTGTVKYSFGVAGSGKVTGVTASAPDNLDAAGIVPCVRKTVYGHKFPSFDGPEMRASSSFKVQ